MDAKFSDLFLLLNRVAVPKCLPLMTRVSGKQSAKPFLSLTSLKQILRYRGKRRDVCLRGSNCWVLPRSGWISGEFPNEDYTAASSLVTPKTGLDTVLKCVLWGTILHWLRSGQDNLMQELSYYLTGFWYSIMDGKMGCRKNGVLPHQGGKIFFTNSIIGLVANFLTSPHTLYFLRSEVHC